RYVWLLKGKLSQEEEEGETKKDKPNFQTTKLKGSFIERDFDDRPKFIIHSTSFHSSKYLS
ncbi:major tail protein, partial [Escherichia sp. SS-MK2]